MATRTQTDISIHPVAPFRLDLTVWSLRRRARNIVDRWDGTTYQRVLTIGSKPIQVSVTQTGPYDRPRLRVSTNHELNGHATALLKASVERTLGTNIDLAPFYSLAQQDEKLRELARTFRGLKPPRFPTVFEALVNAFSCQQLSLTVGIELLNRLTHECGPRSSTGERGFPRPVDILRVSPPRFRELGFSRQKASFILSLAEQVAHQHFDPEALGSLDTDSAREALLNLRGVGRWTAEYVLLRGLRHLDVFPGDDVGARNGLMRWLNRTEEQLDYTGIRDALKRWAPCAGFIYFHLLLKGLARGGEMILASEAPSIFVQGGKYAEHSAAAKSFAKLSGRTLAG